MHIQLRNLIYPHFVLLLIFSTPSLHAQQNSLPRTIQIGADLDALRTLLEEDCQETETLNYTGAMAAPFETQTQVNYSGLEIFGAARDVEFMGLPS